MKINKLILFVIIIHVHLFLFGQDKAIPDKNPISDAIKQLKTDSELKNASVGFLVIDLKTDLIIEDLNSDLSLAPASTQKLITTAASLELLGENHRFATILEYDGTIDTTRKILHGNIYIRGGGDPALGSEYFSAAYYKPYFMDKWVKKTRSLGIDSIDGAIIGDAQVFSTNIIPRMREWEAMGNYYGAGACGLTVYDNLYKITFKSGINSGDPTQVIKIEPEIPGLELDNYVVASTSSADNAYIFGAPYTYRQMIRGSIPRARNEFAIKGAIPDPAFLAAYQLKEKLESTGVSIRDSATTIRILKLRDQADFPSRQPFDTIHSPNLEKIVYRINKVSFNLYPELLAAHIGLKQCGTGDVETGTYALKAFWQSKGMDVDGMSLFDGCGLYRGNMVTARQLVFVLKYMKLKGRYYSAFYESLPVAGESGTIARMFKGTTAQGNLRAKSGSVNNVRAYAGYVNSKSDRELAFAILVNNYNCSGSQMRKKLEKVMIAIANFNY